MERQKILDNVWIRAFVVFCAIALFFILCYFLKGILISLFLAFTIAYIFDPAADFLTKRKLLFTKKNIPRGLAIAILLTGIIVVFGGLIVYTVPKTINGIQYVGKALKTQSPKVLEALVNTIGGFGDAETVAFLKSQLGVEETKEVEIKEKQVEEEEINDNETKDIVAAEDTITEKSPPPEFVLRLKSKLKEQAPQILKLVTVTIKKLFSSTFGFFGIIMNIVIFGVVTVYLLKDFNVIVSKGRGLLPAKSKEKISDIMSKIDGNLKAFFRGQIMVCAILSVIYGIGLTVLGVPMSFLLAVLGGFGNIIPYIGLALGLIPALILAFLQDPDNITNLVLVGMVFGIGQFFEGILLTPKIVGTKLGLHPVAIIVAILICGQILGFLGLLLAVPIAAVVKVLIDEGIIKYKTTKFFEGS